ncbi:MAG TPA: GIDE domain-containing protein [Solimonas sp.]|nr:GIDE domain-containing protein [Solimonas sp.]
MNLPAWAEGLATASRGADPFAFWLWTSLAGGAALLLFLLAFRHLRHARLLQDTPVSRIRSAAQGYARLEGLARLLPGPEIHSPLSGARCCWWWYRIERRETTVHNGRRSTEWVTVEAETSGELFLLTDTDGDCIVDPQGATVYPSLQRQWRGRTLRPQQVPQKPGWLQFGDYRYSEKLIQFGDPLCALGQFRSQTGLQQAGDEVGQVRELLAEWKRDRESLLGRFDADRNGEIDQQEWEAVRRAAIEAVRGQQLARALEPDIHVLDRSRDGRPLLLSTLSEAQLLRRQRFWVAGCLLAALLLGAGVAVALQGRPVPM